MVVQRRDGPRRLREIDDDDVFSYLRTLTTWHCPHSPDAAAAIDAIDQFLLPAGSTAANLQPRVCCCESMLGQTDGQTDGHRIVS